MDLVAAPVLDKHILRLDVSMDDWRRLSVEVSEGVEQLDGDLFPWKAVVVG